VRAELAQGAYFTSMLGYGLVYNSLDNNKLPTSGIYISFGQDFAGAGGDVSYLRSIVDMRGYYEVVSDLISILHLQAGDMLGFNNCPTPDTCVSNDGYVRMLDDFKMGPNLVRGFQPAGIGPRDITPGTITGTNPNPGGSPITAPFVCQCGMQYADTPAIRASVGASIIWDSPFGPLRFDFAYPFLREGYDRTQFFAFGGGTKF
jgi:outer membrane protein insertion porin family